MIDFSLFNEVLTHVSLLSVVIIVLLAVRRYVIEHIGVNAMYFIWGLVPLSLLIMLVPAPWQQVHLAEPVESLVVSASSTVRGYSSKALWQEVWLIGIVLGLLLIGVQHVHSLRQLGLIPADKRLLRQQGVSSKTLSLYYSERVKSPILIGILRSKLVLPTDFESSLPVQQQQLIIEHEMCHIQRRDNLWNFMAFTLVLCFWFNPLVWLAYRYFRRDQELSCDATVLANKPQLMRIEYSKALLAVAINEQRLPNGTLAFKQLTTPHQLVERVSQIKCLKAPTQRAVSLLVVSVTVTLISLSFIGKIYSDHRVEQDFKLDIVTRISPKYPLKAAQQKIEGFVKLAFDVNENGIVSNIRVLGSAPENTFEQNAKYALSQWRYKSVGFDVKNQQLQMDFVMDE